MLDAELSEDVRPSFRVTVVRVKGPETGGEIAPDGRQAPVVGEEVGLTIAQVFEAGGARLR